ncbi:6-phosphogluconate dehydrogenase [Aspergillus pseudonomiae]|uniref:2-dehydropantoate 2-reductase n=1 Tax=Aspergillus pseudonomiae TaxID=1506151 RepID=A0A5N7DBG5_9EURO|nr:6-phosphogluconate dehydrogenase [Aspergillus pseudonomiae]KAE8403495.1 6-phosphogluconate dehydrogenase [Aspergillus pseudonomiae]
MSNTKANILLIGSGGVGTIAALNLEAGNLAQVTAVLRSNYQAVASNGFNITSCDHGTLKGWKPTTTTNRIPEKMAPEAPKYDYIVCTTKVIADCPPLTADLIKPAVTPGHTVIVLIQNGLNIEKPYFAAFPENIVLSGISMIDSHEVAPGVIEHGSADDLVIGAFRNPNLDCAVEVAAAERFVGLYSAAGKTKCILGLDVAYSRWRKLIFNACLNSICALTGLDTGRIRLAGDAVEMLVRPAMEEIRAAAGSVGVNLPAEVCEEVIGAYPVTMYLPPSMLEDVWKGNLIEVESIVGEPLRVGRANGVAMPTLSVLYNLLKGVQWKTKEQRGLIEIPAQGGSVAES